MHKFALLDQLTAHILFLKYNKSRKPLSSNEVTKNNNEMKPAQAGMKPAHVSFIYFI